MALSGGGDSVALLALTAEWAQAHRRRVLALTVDHGLNPQSRDWSRKCEGWARGMGCDWRGLVWIGDKPATGLPAAARAARHALLGEAAREAGASVILTGHTADDAAEADLMRAEGTPIGRLRDWSPSPAWPEGRGLMLLRPLLAERREALRALLRARGLDWIEDPANADQTFARARVRARCPLPEGEGLRLAERSDAPAERVRVHSRQSTLALSREDDGYAAVRSSPLPMGEGILTADRTIDARTLAAVLTCVGGGSRPPQGARLDRLVGRLRSGEDFDAVLRGTRLSARGDGAIVHREPGEQRRSGLAALALAPHRPTIWDGRFEITASDPGLTVVPALGRLAALGPADRAALAALPPKARGAEPVLIRDGDPRPVLARRAARVRSLVGPRLAAALDRMPHEADLISARMAPDRPTSYFEPDTDGRSRARLTERTE